MPDGNERVIRVAVRIRNGVERRVQRTRRARVVWSPATWDQPAVSRSGRTTAGEGASTPGVPAARLQQRRLLQLCLLRQLKRRLPVGSIGRSHSVIQRHGSAKPDNKVYCITSIQLYRLLQGQLHKDLMRHHWYYST